jgi:predicted MFS family arabinose efflux permease
LFVIHHFLSGLSEVSFMDLVGKVIPAGRRGSFFGLRRFLGGILALGGSLFIRCILGRGNGEVQYQNFAVLFLASFLTMSMAMACFSLIVEPVESMPAKNPSFGGQLAPAFGLLRSDENFQRFLIARLCLIGSEVAAPFYVLYAQEGLDVSGAMMGIYLAVMTAATIVSNLIWGYLVDHGQTRLLLQSATVIGTLVPLGAMLIIGSTVCSLASVTHLAAWAFAIVFLLLGGFKTGCTLGHQNFLLSAAPPAHRPTYIALANSVVGGGLLLGSLGGLVVEIMGFEPLFLFAMVSCLVGLFFVLRLKEEGYPEQ